MTCVRDHLMAKARIERPQLLRRLNRDNAAVSDDKQAWDGNAPDQFAVIRVRRRENLEGARYGLQPRVDDQFKQLARSVRLPLHRLGQQLILVPAEQLAVLLGDGA